MPCCILTRQKCRGEGIVDIQVGNRFAIPYFAFNSEFWVLNILTNTWLFALDGVISDYSHSVGYHFLKAKIKVPIDLQ